MSHPKECNHIIATEDFGYDGMHIYYAQLEFSWQKQPDPKRSSVVMFNFCPICGVKLEWEEEV